MHMSRAASRSCEAYRRRSPACLTDSPPLPFACCRPCHAPAISLPCTCHAAHMFDRTSVIMLCMMTIAFLIPCVLSYAPALRLLHFPGFISPAARHSSYDMNRAQYSIPEAPAGGGWAAYSTGGSYAGAIPPRPAARVRPGTHPAS